MTLGERRRERLCGAMRDAGIALYVGYGNAWQVDYLRYACDFGILEGHGIVTVSASGECALYLDSAVEAERALVETSGIAIHLVPEIVGAVGARLVDAPHGRIGAAPMRLLPAGLAETATGIALTDATALVDRLLMHKLPEELERIRAATHLADDAYRIFMQAAVAGRPQYELVADVESYLRARGAADNFMILGSGGVDVRAMTPPSNRRLATGDLVTTELTPACGGYYAQICRTLVVGEASGAQRSAFAVFREALDAGIDAVRPGVRASDVARAENDIFRAHGLGDYVTSAYTRVRGHGVGLFPDSKPHILEDVDVVLEPGMAFVVHPNTYHPAVGYIVLGDTVIVTETGVEVVTQTGRELFEVAA